MRLVLRCAAGETGLTSQEVRGGQVSDPLATQTVSDLSAPHRAVAPLGWQFDSVVLGCLSLPQPWPRWYEPGLTTPSCRAQGLPRRTRTGTVFQLSTRLLYLPSWGPCHLFFSVTPFAPGMRLTGSSPGSPTCRSSIDKTAVSALGAVSFGPPIALGLMACLQGGARGRYMGKKAL